jgi:hypothetical protein
MTELKKINELEAAGNWDLEAYVYKMMGDNSPEKRKSIMHKGNASPNAMNRLVAGGRASPTGTKGRMSPNNYK